MPSRLNFSLTQLEYVLAVARHGQFSVAARQCHVTQPTLSMQIQKLEEEVGTVLFDRSKKPILLTEQGKILIEQMKSVVFEARKIAGILESQTGKTLTGTLTLGVIPTVAPYILPRLLPVAERLYPGLSLNILEMQTDAIVEALHSDEIDVGILAIPLGIPKIHEMGIYVEPFSVLCQKTHKMAGLKQVDYKELDSEEIWLLEEGHCLRNQVLDVCSLKTGKESKRKYLFESGSLETLKSLVNSFGGYTLLPSLAAETVGPKTVLIPFSRPVPAREIGLVYVREHYKADLHQALAKAVGASVPEDLRNLKRKDLEVIPVE